MASRAPIGVFDSGLGGLTVLEELHRSLPQESFIYLGDVARLPYGTKSKNVVTRYAQNCVDFLNSHDVKQIVVACNTASALALEALQKHSSVEVIGVIDSGVQAGVTATRSGHILVLATESTIRSEAYLKRFRSHFPRATIAQIACPLLVPLAEEGWFDSPITSQVIASYLAQGGEGEFDTVVLGCTHYPLLAPSFAKILSPMISVVHGAPFLAAEVKARLIARDALAVGSERGTVRFFSTDKISATLPLLTKLFPGRTAAFEQIDL